MPIYQDGPDSYTDVPTGSAARLRDNLRRLTQPDPEPGALAPVGRPTAITDGKGLGAGPQANASGIASPLTEQDYATRAYHTTEATLTTSDGLFTIKVKRLKHMELKDANDRDVVLEFDEP